MRPLYIWHELAVCHFEHVVCMLRICFAPGSGTLFWRSVSAALFVQPRTKRAARTYAKVMSSLWSILIHTQSTRIVRH